MEPSCVNWVRLKVQYSMLLYEVVYYLIISVSRHMRSYCYY